MNAENRDRDPSVVSKPNSNGTRDYGIPQLNDTYHFDFINSERFKSSKNQIDYGLEVWQDAIKKGRMPRAGFKHREERGVNVLFTEKINHEK